MYVLYVTAYLFLFIFINLIPHIFMYLHLLSIMKSRDVLLRSAQSHRRGSRRTPARGPPSQRLWQAPVGKLLNPKTLNS